MTELRFISVLPTPVTAVARRESAPAAAGKAAPAPSARGQPPQSTRTAETRLRQASSAPAGPQSARAVGQEVPGQAANVDGDEGGGVGVPMPEGGRSKEFDPERGGPKGAARAGGAIAWKRSKQVAGGGLGSGEHGSGGSGTGTGTGGTGGEAWQDDKDQGQEENRENKPRTPLAPGQGAAYRKRLILALAPVVRTRGSGR